MSKLVTSGTGHVPVPVSARAPRGARTPPHGGDKKISKARFGFKGIAKNFLLNGLMFSGEQLARRDPGNGWTSMFSDEADWLRTSFDSHSCAETASRVFAPARARS